MAAISAVLRQLQTLMATQRAEGQTDAQLLEQFVANRDEVAFASLLERHGSMVLGVCRRILHDEHAAEDTFQAAFLVLVRKAGSIRKQPSIASWLHGVAMRLARKAKADAARANRLDARNATQVDIDIPADACCHEAQVILDDELQRLPENYRLPLVLCYLEGLTRDEAAARLGWSANKLRGCLERGRDRLRSQLLRRGVTLSAAASATLLTDTILAAAVPPLLAVATIHAVSRLAAGAALTACGVSAPVVALTQGGLKMVASKKLIGMLALALFTAIIGTGAGIFGQRHEPIDAKNDPAPAVAQVKADEPKQGADRSDEPLPTGALNRIGSGRWRHGTRILASALSPDGKRLATASDESVAVRDLASGTILQRFILTPGNGFDLSKNLVFSPDGKRLGFVRNSSMACVWDLDTAKEIMHSAVNGPPSFFRGACRFTPDSNEFVMAFGSGLHVWNLKEGKGTHSVAMSNGVSVLSTDATICACPADDKTVVLHDARTGVERARLKVCPHPGRVSQEFALSSDNKYAASVDMDKLEILIFELADGKVTASFPLPKSALARSADGKDHWFFCLGFSAEGRTLLLGTRGGMIHGWDVATKKELPVIGKHADMVNGFHTLPDGKSVISTSWDGLIRQWDRDSGIPSFDPECYGGPTKAVLSPDGRFLAVGDAQGRLDLWDAASGKKLENLQKRGPAVTQLAISSDGATLAATLYDGMIDRDLKADSWVQFWKIPSGQKANVLTTKGEHDLHGVFALQFSPDGRHLCVNDAKRQAGIWDLNTGKLLWKRRVSFTAFSPDGRTVTAWANELRFLDSATGEIRKSIVCDPSHPENARSKEVFAYSPDGKRMAVTIGKRFDMGRTGIMLLDLETQNLGKPFPAVDGKRGLPKFFPETAGYTVNALAFSLDGKWLLSGGSDRTVRLWDAITSKELLSFDGQTGGVQLVACSPDGRTALSSSEDGQVFRWDLRPKRAAAPQLKLEELWTNLGTPDAYAATWTLADDHNSPKFLRSKIAPVKPVTREKLAKLIAALDSPSFPDRQAAAKGLTELGDLATAALKESLRKPPSVEFSRRVEALLAALHGEPDVAALRQLRAIQTLELAGTSGARLVLQAWASGADGVRLTEESKAALMRLDHREWLRKGKS